MNTLAKKEHDASHDGGAADGAIHDEAATGWTDVGEVDLLFAEGPCHGAQLEGRRIGLFLVEGCVHAIDDVCTHGNALLSEGELEGHEIECPLHAGLVDVRDGRAKCSPIMRDTAVHEVRLAAGKVWIRIGAAP